MRKSMGDHISGHRGRWIFLLLTFLFITSIGFLWPAHETPLAPVIMMRQPFTIPPAKVGLLDRVMPTSKAWAPLWRLRYAVFGKIKSINLDSTIIDFTGLDISTLADLLPHNPDFAGS